MNCESSIRFYCQFLNSHAKQNSLFTLHFSLFIIHRSLFAHGKTRLESKIRTCNLPRPRRVNNHRYLSSFSDSLPFFSGRQPEQNFHESCGLCGNRTRSTQETVGQVSHYLNRPFFCNSERNRTSNLRFRKPTLYPIELQNQ